MEYTEIHLQSYPAPLKLETNHKPIKRQFKRRGVHRPDTLIQLA